MPDDARPRRPLGPGTAALLGYLGGLAMPAPRILGFVVSERLRARGGQDNPDRPPAARLTPGLVAMATLDELIVAVMKTPGRLPTHDGYARAGAELRDAHAFYRGRGWIEEPARFHPAPPPLAEPRIARSRWPGLSFEHLSFESEYEPDPGDPGRDRWLSHGANRTAHAWLLRHRDATRPWVVVLHAFGMGTAQLDLRAFRAAWLHRELGLNVILPVAPLHGPRRVGRLSGAEFMSYNLVDMVHGFAQAVWDVRRILGWIRASGGDAIGLYGASMGAHVAALLAGLDPHFACVLSAFPTADLTDLFIEHGPRRMRRLAQEHGLLGDEAAAVHRLVSPLAFPARVPAERLFVCAGLADRMATPAQAHRLWVHWGKPRIEWFHANHIAFLWSREVAAFVREALTATGLA